MKTAIRLRWNPVQDRIHLMHRMHDAGYPANAVARMLADMVDTIAEIEIAPDGALSVLRTRRPGICNAASNGARCEGTELHLGLHYGHRDGTVVTWPRDRHPDDIEF